MEKEIINLRKISPKDYPQELRQTIYDAKTVLKLKRQIIGELEHAKTYRKKALNITLLEVEKLLEMAGDAIKSGTPVDIKSNVKIVSAIVSGEIRRVELKEEEN